MISPVGVHVHHSRAAATVMRFPWYLSHHVQKTSQETPQFDVFSPKNSKVTVFLHSQHWLAPSAEADKQIQRYFSPVLFFWQETNEIVAIKKFKDSEGRTMNPVFFFFFLLSVSSASLSLLVRFPTAVPTSLYPRILFLSPRRK